MANYKILNENLPLDYEEEIVEHEELSFAIEDDFALRTGEYVGRLASYQSFISKGGIKFAKITIGFMQKLGNKKIIQEVERVFYADYHAGSDLIKFLKDVGCVVGDVCYPERILNKAVKFIIAENTEMTSPHKFLVTEIKLIDKLSAERDFIYVRKPAVNGFEFIPVANETKKEDSYKESLMRRKRRPPLAIAKENEDEEEF